LGLFSTLIWYKTILPARREHSELQLRVMHVAGGLLSFGTAR
jgi:hypothetical protein